MIFYLLFVLLFIPINTFAITREEYNDALVKMATSAATTYQSDFVYTYRWDGTPENPIDRISLLKGTYLTNAKNGIKIKSGYILGTTKSEAGKQGHFENKFPVYCGSFVNLMIYQLSNGRVSRSDYEKIKVSELKRGDIIDFKNHTAIYLDDGGDTSGYTWNVIEASGKVKTGITHQPIEDMSGARIKESALSKLDYNLTFTSYDYHDRLDDYAPIITSVSEIANTNKIQINATDYKHYDLADKSDILEPESNGIIAYQVKTNSTVPTTDWKTVSKTSNLSVNYEVSGNGKYYVFVKDVGGNVTSKEVTLTKIVVDKEKPTLGYFSYESKENSIVVTINNATDNSGIKEYRFYIDDQRVGTSTNKKYEIKNLQHNKKYSLYYEVVDNYGNVNKSSSFDVYTEIDAVSITVSNKKINLLIGESQKLSPEIKANNSNYNIKYNSDNDKVCSVDSNGTIKAKSSGDCVVTISVGKTTTSVNVKVSSVNLVFNQSELPVAYIDNDYDVLIETSPQGQISIKNSKIPDGLYIENNHLKGKPTENAYGSHIIYFLSTYNDSQADGTLVLTVNYKLEISDLYSNIFYTGRDYEEYFDINYPASVYLKSGQLPKGLSLKNNVISGVPTEVGEFTFTITAEYMNVSQDKTFNIKVLKDEEVIVEEEKDDTPIETEENVNIKEQQEANGDIISDNSVEDTKEDNSFVEKVLIIFVIVAVIMGLILTIEVVLSKKNRRSNRNRRYR